MLVLASNLTRRTDTERQDVSNEIGQSGHVNNMADLINSLLFIYARSKARKSISGRP